MTGHSSTLCAQPDLISLLFTGANSSVDIYSMVWLVHLYSLHTHTYTHACLYMHALTHACTHTFLWQIKQFQILSEDLQISVLKSFLFSHWTTLKLKNCAATMSPSCNKPIFRTQSGVRVVYDSAHLEFAEIYIIAFFFLYFGVNVTIHMQCFMKSLYIIPLQCNIKLGITNFGEAKYLDLNRAPLCSKYIWRFSQTRSSLPKRMATVWKRTCIQLNNETMYH